MPQATNRALPRLSARRNAAHQIAVSTRTVIPTYRLRPLHIRIQARKYSQVVLQPCLIPRRTRVHPDSLQRQQPRRYSDRLSPCRHVSRIYNGRTPFDSAGTRYAYNTCLGLSPFKFRGQGTEGSPAIMEVSNVKISLGRVRTTS